MSNQSPEADCDYAIMPYAALNLSQEVFKIVNNKRQRCNGRSRVILFQHELARNLRNRPRIDLKKRENFHFLNISISSFD
jgi:hypothetical protein